MNIWKHDDHTCSIGPICRACLPWRFNDKFDVHIPFFTGADDVWFSLRDTTYQNNSNVTLEDIGEGSDALHCMTNLTTCCHRSVGGENVRGNWFFPNGTRVPSSGVQWDFHRTRGRMVVRMQRRRGGAEGVYRCEIPDTFGLIQTLYIEVYSASTGEWCMCTPAYCTARNLVRVSVWQFGGSGQSCQIKIP